MRSGVIAKKLGMTRLFLEDSQLFSDDALDIPSIARPAGEVDPILDPEIGEGMAENIVEDDTTEAYAFDGRFLTAHDLSSDQDYG